MGQVIINQCRATFVVRGGQKFTGEILDYDSEAVWLRKKDSEFFVLVMKKSIISIIPEKPIPFSNKIPAGTITLGESAR